MAIEKWIRDGKVAVIVSPGFGAGWSTWGNPATSQERAFDRGLGELIEAGKKTEAKEYATQKWPEERWGGLYQCRVEWLAVGTKFTIHEYDGSESLRLIEDLSMTA